MKRGLVLSLCACALAAATTSAVQAQAVRLSLNLRYNDPADPSEGGTWTLVGKAASGNGLAAINAIISNINSGGITLQSGIGAMTITGNPIAGPPVEILYAQDTSVAGSVVLNVGRGDGVSGNGNAPGEIVDDPLDGTPLTGTETPGSTFDGASQIASGTFGASRPAFVANGDTPPDVTDANVLSTATAPFNMSAAASLTLSVRGDSVISFGLNTPAGSGLFRGDANRDFRVNGDDFNALALNFPGIHTNKTWDQGDFTDDGEVNGDDFNQLAVNFNKASPVPTSSAAAAGVPEPATIALLGLGGIGLLALGRRRAA